MRRYIKFSFDGEQAGLFSRHYLFDLLAQSDGFQKADFSQWLAEFQAIFQKTAPDSCNEREIEAIVFSCCRIMGMENAKFQAPIGEHRIDFAFFDGQGFLADYSNVYTLCEVKRTGILPRKYHISRQDHSDPIFQIRSYLKSVNLLRQNHDLPPLDFAFLTDGKLWRIYGRFFTHSDPDFAANFIEFDLAGILAEPDPEKQAFYFKCFAWFFGAFAWKRNLIAAYRGSQNLSQEVSRELNRQVFTALELLSTGIWRNIQADIKKGAINARPRLAFYGVDADHLRDPIMRRKALDLVYQESVVYLLRILFLLYAEDRDMLSQKVIKKKEGILDRLRAANAPIGRITDDHPGFKASLSWELSQCFSRIDAQYDGGVFSNPKHPLLYDLAVDPILFANMMDNLCRVYIGTGKQRRATTVDFGSISVRELGTLYEGLLEYKLAEIERDIPELPSFVDKQKKRLHVKKGDLQLINHKGERKATGSYYTPDRIVNYLVSQSLEPLINPILESDQRPQKKLEAILCIKVCDPAMGSGHFLVRAFQRIMAKLRQLQEEHADLILDRDLRARVARKCIYGVDANPLAVELARMVLWIITFRPDKPLEFFEANLKCGDSLLGIFEKDRDDPEAEPEKNHKNSGFIQLSLDAEERNLEADIRRDLAQSVRALLNMKNKTREDIQKKQDYYHKNVYLKQKNLTFVYHLKLIRYLFPEQIEMVRENYDQMLKKIQKDHNFIAKLYRNNRAGVAETFKTQKAQKKVHAILDLVEKVTGEYRPVHWTVEFPHVFENGGFDVVLGNPPWDTLRPDHKAFFSDYIPGYGRMETQQAKRLSEKRCAADPGIAARYQAYCAYYETLNGFFRDGYRWQVVTDRKNRKLKGDNNLFKIFVERAFQLLRKGGNCGLVVPSALNSDRGCSGLRRLLFENSTVHALIMFENRRRLFPEVDMRYKFNVLSFCKRKPAETHRTETGFYWQDPWWLEKEDKWTNPGGKLNYAAEARIHRTFAYPLELTRKLAPDTESLIEFRSQADIGIVEKLSAFPLFGDTDQRWYALVYNEFHMTNDSDIFNTQGRGYPLLEGKCIHQFDPFFQAPTRFVVSKVGEERLAKKWKAKQEELPGRGFRIAVRDISRSTDSRTVIACVLPRFVFCGNTLNLIKLKGEDSPLLIAGVTALLNSLTLDYLMRFRVSIHVNAFYIKQIPIIRDTEAVKALGKAALPLFYGPDLTPFRGEAIEPLPPEADKKRAECRALLDARVAQLYDLEYEELQHVLSCFPLVEAEYKEAVLRRYREL